VLSRVSDVKYAPKMLEKMRYTVYEGYRKWDRQTDCYIRITARRGQRQNCYIWLSGDSYYANSGFPILPKQMLRNIMRAIQPNKVQN